MPARTKATLLDAVTATGAGSAVDSLQYNCFSFFINASSVTTGGTVKIQGLTPVGDWVDISTTTVTADGDTLVQKNGAYLQVRANLTARTDGTYYVGMVAKEGRINEAAAEEEGASEATPPSGNLFAHYKSDTGVTKDGGNAVSAWTDDTGNGHDITQATGTKQPIWADAQINGFPSIDFDGVDDNLKATSFTSKANATVGFIVRKDGTHTGAIFDGHTNNQQMLYFEAANARRIRSYAGGYGPWTDLGPESGVWYAVIVRFQASSLARLVCRNLATDTETADTLGNIPSPSFTGITVGTQGAGTYWPLNGEIAEIIVYNEASTDAKITELMTYFQDKYIP
jgi:hypothetical protein